MVKEECQQYDQTNADLQASFSRIPQLNGNSLKGESGKLLGKLRRFIKDLPQEVFTGTLGVNNVCAQISRDYIRQLLLYSLVSFVLIHGLCRIFDNCYLLIRVTPSCSYSLTGKMWISSSTKR